MRLSLRHVCVSLGALTLSLLFLSLTLCDVLIVRGASMTNTLKDGDRILVLRTDLLASLPRVQRAVLRKGRIVAFRSPIRAEDLFIKRIVATEGDAVRIDHTDLLVNNRVESVPATVIPLDRSWPPLRDGEIGRNVTIPRGQYFVLSDNRLQELDSRTLGPLTRHMIVAVVIRVLSHESMPSPGQAASISPPSLR